MLLMGIRQLQTATTPRRSHLAEVTWLACELEFVNKRWQNQRRCQDWAKLMGSCARMPHSLLSEPSTSGEGTAAGWIAKLPTDPEAVAWNALLGLTLLMALTTLLRFP
jgi:hypothetical protein